METKQCLIMCRTGMGSSMMLKIKVDKLIVKNHWPMEVTHDALDGMQGRQADIIITMSDLVPEFRGTDAYVIGVKDIMDSETLEKEIQKYFDQCKE